MGNARMGPKGGQPRASRLSPGDPAPGHTSPSAAPGVPGSPGPLGPALSSRQTLAPGLGASALAPDWTAFPPLARLAVQDPDIL